MAADVVEAAQGPVLAAHHHQPMAGDLGGDPVARLGRLGLVAQEQPGAAEHGLTLAGVGVRVAIEAGGQSALHRRS